MISKRMQGEEVHLPLTIGKGEWLTNSRSNGKVTFAGTKICKELGDWP